MYKGLLGALFIVGALVPSAWAQGAGNIDPNIRVVDTTTEPPASSVDLLKQAASQNSPLAPTTSKATRVPRVPKTPPAAEVSTTTLSTTTVSTTTAAKPVAPAAGANTLDMPLTIGGTNTSVQTKVASPAPTSPKKISAFTAPVNTVVSTDTATAQPGENTEEEDAADAELEYAMKMLEKSKEEAQGSRVIPPSAAKNRPAKVPAANKKFNPSAFRPGVEWIPSKSTHFEIYTQKAEDGAAIGSANMSLNFETAYNALRRLIPWMLSGKVRAFVYQDHNSYLRYEPEAKAWTRAISYPTRGEIVVYDEPGHSRELQEVFAHELTHIFTQQFFDKHNTGRIMTPTWLDEGLAVFVEDQMFSRGGPWDHDYRTLRFERDPSTMANSFTSASSFGFGKPKSFMPPKYRDEKPTGPRRGKPVRLMPFEDFMREGSLDSAEGRGQANVQNWYLQAYLMVRFLLNPGGGISPSNRMQFEQFTRLIAQGEAVRNPSTGFLVKDSRGKQVYEPYSVEKALAKVYRYNNIAAFEDAFWRWLQK